MTTRVGVAGYGLGGRTFHAPFIEATPGLELSAVLQRTSRQAAEDYPGIRLATSLDDLLADETTEVIVVTTPSSLHAAHAERCLRAGKHVVVDKPFAATAAEARRLIAIAAEMGRLLTVFQNRRWDGDFLTVRHLLDQGALGRLVTFESRFDRYRPALRGGVWKEIPEPGNGLLFDLGSHLADQALVLFGRPEAVSADIRRDRDGSEIEDAFDITLYYPGLRARLGSTLLAADPTPRFLLHGTAGSFRKRGVDPQEETLLAGRRPTTPDWLREPEADWGTLTAGGASRAIETRRGDYRGFYAALRDAIQQGAPPPVDPADAARTIRILELARQSSAERRAIPVTAEDWA